MAKIAANGEKEIARLKAKSAASGDTYLFVLTAGTKTGRVLRRPDPDTLREGFTVAHRIRLKENFNEEFLRRHVMLRGLTII